MSDPFETDDAGIGDPASMPPSGGGGRGLILFKPGRKGMTRAEYAVESPSRLGLMLIAWGVLWLGLIVLVVLCWALTEFVARSPNPGVRIQSVQMVQAIHVLWPPFLLAGLARSGRTQVLTLVDSLVHNLPHRDPS